MFTQHLALEKQRTKIKIEQIVSYYLHSKYIKVEMRRNVIFVLMSVPYQY